MTIQEAKTELQGILLEFFDEVSKQMDTGKSYMLATMDVCKRRPDLVDREIHLRDYVKGLERAARDLAILGTPVLTDPQADVASEIDALAKEKVAASEGRIDYGTAFKTVLCQRPDLERACKDAIRSGRPGIW